MSILSSTYYAVMGLMNLMNLLIIFKFRRMKTIEERAMEYAPEPLNNHYAIPAFIASENKRQAYIAGATEQKDIDDAKLLKLKSAWEKEAQTNHNDELNYKQGYHDAIEKAKTAFGKACGWLSTYLWYNAVVEEFIKNMEE